VIFVDSTYQVKIVDGSEIRHQPVDVVNMAIIYRVSYIQKVVSRISEPSTVLGESSQLGYVVNNHG